MPRIGIHLLGYTIVGLALPQYSFLSRRPASVSLPKALARTSKSVYARSRRECHANELPRFCTFRRDAARHSSMRHVRTLSTPRCDTYCRSSRYVHGILSATFLHTPCCFSSFFNWRQFSSQQRKLCLFLATKSLLSTIQGTQSLFQHGKQGIFHQHSDSATPKESGNNERRWQPPRERRNPGHPAHLPARASPCPRDN
jgi:hypothetical protein